MTEAEWLACVDAERMLDYLRRTQTATDRQLRLFGCACCRRIWDLLTDDRNRRAVEVAEQFADGLTGTKEMAAARRAAQAGRKAAEKNLSAARDSGSDRAERGALAGAWLGASATFHNATACAGWRVALLVFDAAAEAVAWRAACHATGILPPRFREVLDELATWRPARKAALLREEREQADLLRHIVGNPFQPVAVAGGCTSTILTLAEALYAGEDCAFALHDALLDAGQVPLAEHFREPRHPRGCWALDAILHKTPHPFTPAVP